jgi:dTDP-4-dehydrorhamnose 3,5-epimerase-like enzyme
MKDVFAKQSMTTKIQITELNNRGDARGFSFTAPAEALAFVGRMADVHFSSAEPGAVRGNHYHLRRRTAIVVLPGAKWSLHWDQGEAAPAAETPVAQHREFDGARAVLVLVSPGASHAVRNDGESTMWLVAISSESYDPAESVARKVV